MARVYKCDRCGKIYDKDVDNKNYVLSKIEYSFVEPHDTEVDLCPTCMSILENFINNKKNEEVTIYIGGRQTGKTLMLINESAKTKSTIAVATRQMVNNIKETAKKLGVNIPEPVLYRDIFINYMATTNKKYLVDELQMMLKAFNIEISTLDSKSVFYL